MAQRYLDHVVISAVIDRPALKLQLVRRPPGQQGEGGSQTAACLTEFSDETLHTARRYLADSGPRAEVPTRAIGTPIAVVATLFYYRAIFLEGDGLSRGDDRGIGGVVSIEC